MGWFTDTALWPHLGELEAYHKLGFRLETWLLKVSSSPWDALTFLIQTLLGQENKPRLSGYSLGTQETWVYDVSVGNFLGRISNYVLSGNILDLVFNILLNYIDIPSFFPPFNWLKFSPYSHSFLVLRTLFPLCKWSTNSKCGVRD